jgi:hypothetical protein
MTANLCVVKETLRDLITAALTSCSAVIVRRYCTTVSEEIVELSPNPSGTGDLMLADVVASVEYKAAVA